MCYGGKEGRKSDKKEFRKVSWNVLRRKGRKKRVKKKKLRKVLLDALRRKGRRKVTKDSKNK